MDYNEKFFRFYEYLKQQGILSTYVELAEVLNTNKAGINDLKSGKKKLSLEHVFSMKKSYPFLNIDWFIFDDEKMLIDETKSKEKVIKENDNLNDNLFDNKPKVKKRLSNETNPEVEWLQKDVKILEANLADIRRSEARLVQDNQDLKHNYQELKEELKTTKQELKESLHREMLLKIEVEKLKNVSDLGNTRAEVG